MTEVGAREKAVLLMPFYTDQASGEYPVAVEAFADFALQAQKTTELPLAIIDDGAGLDRRRFGKIASAGLVTIESNIGKSAAIREGLGNLLDHPNPPELYIQYDSDGDQSFVDIPRLLDDLISAVWDEPACPALVIGNRYSELLKVEPNPSSIEYRQTLLTFFGALAHELTGYENVRDWVSGARGFTKAMAKALVEKGVSSRYGLEAEQLIIAGIIGAKVATSPLTISRPRDPYTLRSKWLQNFEVYNLHASALQDADKQHILDVVEPLQQYLQASEEEFDLDVTKIGVHGQMSFRKHTIDGVEWYSAYLPWETRSEVFATQNGFAMNA